MAYNYRPRFPTSGPRLVPKPASKSQTLEPRQELIIDPYDEMALTYKWGALDNRRPQTVTPDPIDIWKPDEERIFKGLDVLMSSIVRVVMGKSPSKDSSPKDPSPKDPSPKDPSPKEKSATRQESISVLRKATQVKTERQQQQKQQQQQQQKASFAIPEGLKRMSRQRLSPSTSPRTSMSECSTSSGSSVGSSEEGGVAL